MKTKQRKTKSPTDVESTKIFWTDTLDCRTEKGQNASPDRQKTALHNFI